MEYWRQYKTALYREFDSVMTLFLMYVCTMALLWCGHDRNSIQLLEYVTI